MKLSWRLTQDIKSDDIRRRKEGRARRVKGKNANEQEKDKEMDPTSESSGVRGTAW